MKTIILLTASILLAGSAFAAEPQIKVAVADLGKAVAAKPAVKPAQPAKTSTAAPDYRLERESCCGPQN